MMFVRECPQLLKQNLQTLFRLLFDGNSDNTGVGLHNGIIRQLEEALGRSLQWLICFLHFNEFLTTLGQAMSTGPSSSRGVIFPALQFGPKDLPNAHRHFFYF